MKYKKTKIYYLTNTPIGKMKWWEKIIAITLIPFAMIYLIIKGLIIKPIKLTIKFFY